MSKVVTDPGNSTRIVSSRKIRESLLTFLLSGVDLIQFDEYHNILK